MNKADGTIGGATLDDFIRKSIILTKWDRDGIYFIYEGKKYISYEGLVREVTE